MAELYFSTRLIPRHYIFKSNYYVCFKSENLNDYYWGVRPDEANEALPPYQANSGVNAKARVLLSYQINRNWAFVIIGELERLNNEAAASPIVADRNVLAYFAGFGYRF